MENENHNLMQKHEGTTSREEIIAKLENMEFKIAN